MMTQRSTVERARIAREMTRWRPYVENRKPATAAEQDWPLARHRKHKPIKDLTDAEVDAILAEDG